MKVKRGSFKRRGAGLNTSLLPVVPQAGAWRAPRMPDSHWDRKTRSVAAQPEAAVVWSELPEENPGCSSGTAHQPKDTDSGVSSGLRVHVDV